MGKSMKRKGAKLLQPSQFRGIYKLDSKTLNFYDADVSRTETLEFSSCQIHEFSSLEALTNAIRNSEKTLGGRLQWERLLALIWEPRTR